MDTEIRGEGREDSMIAENTETRNPQEITEIPASETFTKLRAMNKNTLTAQVHDRILEMIIQNPSGEQLVLNERRLMEQLGVSKAPVREALIRLCSEGVLVSVPRFGYVVVQLTLKDCYEITDLRVMLEQKALRSSFPSFGEAELTALREQIGNSTQDPSVNVWQIWEDNECFHLMLASFARNHTLQRFLKEAIGMDKRVYAQHIWREKSSLFCPNDKSSHLRIVDAIAGRDLDLACRLLEEDIWSATGLTASSPSGWQNAEISDETAESVAES